MTMTMTRSGKTIEQMQETRKQHTPDVARGLQASQLAPSSSEAKALRGALALS